MATVLVADDDETICELLAIALEAEGHAAVVTMGAATLEAVRAHRPDLLLLDVMMPGMGGGEVARRLRADPATAGVPIVGMSAARRPEGMPADDWLAKPFPLDALYAAVARWAPRADPGAAAC